MPEYRQRAHARSRGPSSPGGKQRPDGGQGSEDTLAANRRAGLSPAPPPAPIIRQAKDLHLVVTIVCLRDPDAANEYAVFAGDERLESDRCATAPGTQVRIVIHDVDAGSNDLRLEEVFCAWAQSHLLAAARMLSRPARHLTEIVATYAPEGGIVSCPRCGSPRAAVNGRIYGGCPWCGRRAPEAGYAPRSRPSSGAD